MKTKLMTALFIFLGAALLPAADWPQWRGPTRDGHFTGAAWPDKLDTNHLQRIGRVELEPSYSGPIVSGERVFTITQTWTHKSQGYMSTPVIIDGVAYEHLKSQRVMAIEIETGRELWTSDKSFGKYWSLVAQGDRILALDQRGQLFLFRANKEKFDLLDQRKLADAETWAHLAVAGDELFVRELNALAAYRWSSTTAAAAAR